MTTTDTEVVRLRRQVRWLRWALIWTWGVWIIAIAIRLILG